MPSPSPVRTPLRPLLVASGIDAFGSMFVLTLVAVHITAVGGLGAAALLANAQMLGYGIGAVATGWLTRRWWLRRVLGCSLGASLAGRLGLLLALSSGRSVVVVVGLAATFECAKAICITSTQAEVVARRPGGVPLGWSAAALSLGMGLGGAIAGLGWPAPAALTAFGSVVPLAVVARGVSRTEVDRSRRLAHLQVVRRAARPLLLGAAVTAIAFGPVVLNVGLTTTVVGPGWVASSVLALHLGALLAPPLAARLLPKLGARPSPTLLPLIAAAVWSSWALVPFAPALLLVAQVASGLALHLYGALHAEMLVARVEVADAPVVLGLRALAWQLSTAAGSAFLPLAVQEVGVTAAASWHVLALGLLALVVSFRQRLRRLARPLSAARAGAASVPSTR